MKSHHTRSMRQIRQVLCILLPILILLLIILLFLRRQQQEDSVVPVQTESMDTQLSDSSPDDNSDSPSASELSSDTENASDSNTQNTEAEKTNDEAAQTTPNEEDILPQREPEPVTLLFTGDVLLSDYVLNNYSQSGIHGVVDDALLSEMQQADLTIINNEFPFSTRGTQAPDKQFTFRVHPDHVRILTDMGVDIASLANNHVLDYGADALLDTFDTLDSSGIDYMGAGADLSRASALITKEVHGVTFGFLSASRVIPVVSWDIRNASPGVFTTYDPSLLISAIEAARLQCDYLTVFVHWGIERDAYPQDYQVTMAQQYIDAGADLVIGAHPHVLQGITYYKDKPVFYSLGNFIFNRSIPQTAAVKVTLCEDQEPTIQLIAATASDACTRTCDTAEACTIFDYLEQISDNISIDDSGKLTQQTE